MELQGALKQFSGEILHSTRVDAVGMLSRKFYEHTLDTSFIFSAMKLKLKLPSRKFCSRQAR